MTERALSSSHAVRDVLDDVDRLWTHPDLGELPTSSVGPARRALDLWLGLADYIPQGLNLRFSAEEWLDHLDSAELQSLLDVAVVRWSQVREIERRSAGTSPDDLAGLIQPVLDLGHRLCHLLITGYVSALPPDSDVAARREVKRLIGRVVGLRDSFKTEIELDGIRQAAAEIQKVRENTRVAAGEIATGDLAQHFEKYRKSERKQAEVLRTIAGLLIAGAVIALAYLVPGERTTAEVLQRAVFSLPIFALAAYLSAESSRHRKAAQWAATLRVQLLTIDLYAAPLSAEEAAETRQILARRAFGEVPMLATGDVAKDEAAMPVSLQAVLERLLVELRSKPDKQAS